MEGTGVSENDEKERSRGKEFGAHALNYLEENFDEPLNYKGP